MLLDLRGTPCPINFVRTKLKLETMGAGELLEVWLDAGEPIEQVPGSLKVEGYGIESIEEREGFFVLLVRPFDKEIHQPRDLTEEDSSDRT